MGRPHLIVWSNVADWARLAHELHSTFDATPFGGREETLRQTADKHGVVGNTLRRALAAYRKAPRVSKATAVPLADIYRLPLASVEALARWVEYDLAGAKPAAREAQRGHASSYSLVAREREARQAAGVGNWGNTRRSRARSIVEKRLAEKMPGQVRCDGADDGIDFRLRFAEMTVAVLVFGPHQLVTPQLLAVFAQRILGLAAVYDRAIAAAATSDLSSVQMACEALLHEGGRLSFADNLRRRLEFLAFSESKVG